MEEIGIGMESENAMTDAGEKLERAVKEIKLDGKVVLMSKSAEKKWRKGIKSKIDNATAIRKFKE